MTRSSEIALVERVQGPLARALAAGDAATVRERLRELHPAEIADVLEAFPSEERPALWRQIPAPVKGDVLVEARREVREQLIGETGVAELVSALERLDVDELADIDHALPAVVVDAALLAMDAQRRKRYEAVRSYPDDTAGGLMDADALAVRDDVTLEVVLRYLRRLRQRQGALPEHTDALMVVTHENRYLGVLHVSDLISLDMALSVARVMDRGVAAISAATPAAKVARRFQDRDLLSAPVIDDEGKLIGRITIDDVFDVMRAREEEATLSPAGLPAGMDLFAPVWRSASRRAAWLGLHLAGAFAAAGVIALFEASIDRLVALAVLMPVVAAAGGVAGNQTQALVTRGLALEQVGKANAARLLRKELGVSLATGAVLALLVGLVAILWFGNAGLAAVFGLALALNLVNAALTGTMVPLALNRLGFDPALGSTVVVTAVTDIIGFLCFLGLATLWLL